MSDSLLMMENLNLGEIHEVSCFEAGRSTSSWWCTCGLLHGGWHFLYRVLFVDQRCWLYYSSHPERKIPQQYRRQIVKYQTDEAPGTIIVETREKFLYLVQPDGKAMRYGIGVGREGFGWSGTARVAMKREWPTWTPPSAMIKRQPELAKYRNGMEPGLRNPLGARALYLFNKGGDTGYRIHGTPEWWSIGKAMSSGCVRMMNQDIIDLYERAEQGAKVIVRQ